jgi:hypothetical protein
VSQNHVQISFSPRIRTLGDKFDLKKQGLEKIMTLSLLTMLNLAYKTTVLKVNKKRFISIKKVKCYFG